MGQERERDLFMSSSITWRVIAKGLFNYWRIPAIIKILMMLRFWERPSISPSKILESSAALSVLKQERREMLPKIRTQSTQMNGFQPWLSRKSRISRLNSMEKWLRLAFLRFSTSLIWFGETSWERRMQLSKESSLFKSRTSVASLWPRKPSMKMSLKEIFLDSRRSLPLLTCNFTTIRDKHSMQRLIDRQEAMDNSRSHRRCRIRKRLLKVKMKTCVKGSAN